MGTAPRPPGSRQSISPPAAVLLMAPANVMHGAVRLHGLASLPTPDTQVRVACALAGRTESPRPAAAIRMAMPLFIQVTPSRLTKLLPFHPDRSCFCTTKPYRET